MSEEERETRLAVRAALQRLADTVGPGIVWDAPMIRNWTDREYPAQTVTRPREVQAPSGMQYKVVQGKLCNDWAVHLRSGPFESWGALDFIPDVDRAVVADLLLRLTEEVPGE